MSKSFKYLWPVILYAILTSLLRLSGTLLPDYDEEIVPISNLLITIGAIFYLYTSPFSQSYFLPLFTLLILRYFIPILVPFTFTTALSFYMGSNMALLFFYSLRTLQKEPRRKIDVSKLILVACIVLLIIGQYVLFMIFELDEMETGSFGILSSIITFATQALIAILVFVHLRMLGKWEADSLDGNEEKLIDEIGRDLTED